MSEWPSGVVVDPHTMEQVIKQNYCNQRTKVFLLGEGTKAMQWCKGGLALNCTYQPDYPVQQQAKNNIRKLYFIKQIKHYEYKDNDFLGAGFGSQHR